MDIRLQFRKEILEEDKYILTTMILVRLFIKCET